MNYSGIMYKNNSTPNNGHDLWELSDQIAISESRWSVSTDGRTSMSEAGYNATDTSASDLIISIIQMFEEDNAEVDIEVSDSGDSFDEVSIVEVCRLSFHALASKPSLVDISYTRPTSAASMNSQPRTGNSRRNRKKKRWGALFCEGPMGGTRTEDWMKD
jgi:hypothetical protein